MFVAGISELSLVVPLVVVMATLFLHACSLLLLRRMTMPAARDWRWAVLFLMLVMVSTMLMLPYPDVAALQVLRWLAAGALTAGVMRRYFPDGRARLLATVLYGLSGLGAAVMLIAMIPYGAVPPGAAQLLMGGALSIQAVIAAAGAILSGLMAMNYARVRSGHWRALALAIQGAALVGFGVFVVLVPERAFVVVGTDVVAAFLLLTGLIIEARAAAGTSA